MSTTDNSTMTDNLTQNDSNISTNVNTIMIDNSIIALNFIIQRSTKIGLMSKEKVNKLQYMLLRNRINTEDLNTIFKLNESFLILNNCLTLSAFATSNVSATSSAGPENSNVQIVDILTYYGFH